MRVQSFLAILILVISLISCVAVHEPLIENRLLAEQGDAKAQYQLGLMYITGQGVQPNAKEAARWYRKAAEQGNSDGQFGLGVLYFHGKGVQQDQKEAAKWYRKAAEQGNSDGQLGLGVLYFMGKGVPRNDRQAYIWLSIASAQGQKEAKEVKTLVEQKLDPKALAEAQKRAEEYYEKYVVPFQ